jgi:hypothetical protein
MAKRQKRVEAAVSWERGKNVTAVCSVSVPGNYIPSMIIYPGKRMLQQLLKNGTVGASKFVKNYFFIPINLPNLQRLSLC